MVNFVADRNQRQRIVVKQYVGHRDFMLSVELKTTILHHNKLHTRTIVRFLYEVRRNVNHSNFYEYNKLQIIYYRLTYFCTQCVLIT